MALEAAGGAGGAGFFSQTICLMYYSQDRKTVLAKMTKSYFYKVANFCFKFAALCSTMQMLRFVSVCNVSVQNMVVYVGDCHF